MGPLNWRPLLMPLNLIKRSERTSAITSAEHDGNFQAIEDSLNGLETQIDTIETVIASLDTSSGTKLANVVEDTTPELGGDLDGLNKTAHNLRSYMVSKTGSFTANPAEAAAYNIQATSNIIMTLPGDILAVPPGTGFEIHVERDIEVTVASDSGNVNHVVNFNGHRKLKGPLGQGFVRVLGPDNDAAVWKLVGTTTATSSNSATAAQWLANPFTRLSPQHRPIGTGAIYASTQETMSRFTGTSINVDNGGAPNVYTIAPGDPVRTVTSDGTGGVNANLPVSLQIPQSIAFNGAINDRVVVLFDPATFICHQLWHYGSSNVTPTAGRYVSWDVRGTGLNVGTSASKFAAMLGLLRGVELATPGMAIQHCLQVVCNTFGDTSVLSKEWVWPSYGRDNSAANADRNLGTVPYGALVAVRPPEKGGPTKASLGLSELGGRLYDCATYYGMYLIDATSDTRMLFRGDQVGWTQALEDEFKVQMEKLRPHVRRITNNFEGQAVAGGGTALAGNNALD